MSEPLAFWAPIVLVLLVCVVIAILVTWNDARVRNRQSAAFEESNRQFRRMLDETRPCPACHGAGRVLREEPIP